MPNGDVFDLNLPLFGDEPYSTLTGGNVLLLVLVSQRRLRFNLLKRACDTDDARI